MKHNAPHIVPAGTPWIPYLSDKKGELISQGKMNEAYALPNLINDDHGRVYVMVPVEEYELSKSIMGKLESMDKKLEMLLDFSV